MNHFWESYTKAFITSNGEVIHLWLKDTLGGKYSCGANDCQYFIKGKCTLHSIEKTFNSTHKCPFIFTDDKLKLQLLLEEL